MVKNHKEGNVTLFISQFMDFFDEHNVTGDELQVIIAALMSELFHWLDLTQSRDQTIMAASIGLRARQIINAAEEIKEEKKITRH